MGNLSINQPAQQTTPSAIKVVLTTSKYKFLSFLANYTGKVVSHDHIQYAVREIKFDGLYRWVENRISRLRKKPNDATRHQQKNRTIWGKGFLFVKDSW